MSVEVGSLYRVAWPRVPDGGIDFNNLTGFINDPRTFGVPFKATF